MTTITQTVAQIPGLPSGVDATPETYPPAAQAFADRLETLPGELNALATQLNTVAGEVNANAQTATTQAALATTNGAAQVALATTQAVNAADSAARALASATAAAQAAPAWAAGTSYSYPQVAVGSDGQTYRCMGTGVVGSDPTANGGLWVRITGAGSNVKTFFLSQA